MNLKNLVGSAICLIVFGAVFVASEGSAQYVNLMGALIVVAGTAGATLLSYPFDDLSAAVKVARNSYTVKAPTAEFIVHTLMGLALRTRRGGIPSLRAGERGIEVSFLRDALGMMVDGFSKDELKEILGAEMQFFARRRRRHERVFRHMSRLAPAFGVAGSVVGLIGMLTGIGDTGVILRTIPLALTSTLYGIVLANFVLTPVSESIHAKTQRELLMQKLVLDGVMAILDERNSHKLERKLKSFLTPAARATRELSFEEIREKCLELRSGEQPAHGSA